MLSSVPGRRGCRACSGPQTRETASCSPAAAVLHRCFPETLENTFVRLSGAKSLNLRGVSRDERSLLVSFALLTAGRATADQSRAKMKRERLPQRTQSK